MSRFHRIYVTAACMSVCVPAFAAQVATTQPTSRPSAAPMVYMAPEVQPGYVRSAYVTSPPWMVTQLSADEVAQKYSCVIRIDTDAGNTNYGFAGTVNDAQSAAALLTSTALLDPAVKATLHVNPDYRQEATVVNVYPVGQRLARVEVALRKIGASAYPEGAAAKVTDALIERLRAAYAESSAAGRKAAEARETPLQKQIDSIKARSEELRDKEREVRGKTSNSRMVYPNGDPSFELNNLRSQKKSTESELTRNRARLETLDPGTGPLVAQWTDIVALRQKQVDDLKKSTDQNKSDPSALQEAQVKLADAKSQLAQARQAKTNDGTNPAFRANEIAALRSNVADEEDRLKDLSAQISKLEDPKFLALLDQLPDMQNEENRLRNQLLELQNRLEQVRHSTQDEGTVTITVLDGQHPPG